MTAQNKLLHLSIGCSPTAELVVGSSGCNSALIAAAEMGQEQPVCPNPPAEVAGHAGCGMLSPVGLGLVAEVKGGFM